MRYSKSFDVFFFSRTIFTIAIFLFVLASCKKEKNAVTEIPEARSGGVKLVSVDLSPGNETISAFTLKAQSGSGTVHVKLALDTAAVVAAGARFLPANSYTAVPLEYDIAANGSLPVLITLNRSNLNVDTVFGIGFKIMQVSSGSIANDAKSIVIKIDLRNRWDGVYRVTGTFTDVAAPTVTFTQFDTYLVTTSPTSVVMIPKDLGIPGYLILSGTSLSYYGSFGPVFNLNPTTNKVTSVVNSYGQPASNTRAGELDPSGLNEWNPASKAITIKFWMNQSNTVTTFPHHRTFFTNTLSFLNARF